MDSKAKVANKIKHQVSKFSGIISKPFPKVKRRLIKELLYGIQASKDVKLSNISRSLKESIPLIKTEDRLSRNLDDIDFTDAVNDKVCSLASSKVLEDTVLALDPGDIIKPFAQKMEYLCKVKDGSKHEKSDGYWLCQVVASNMHDNDVIPMYNEMFSHEADGFESMNKQIIKAIDTVGKYTGGNGIWTIDRGGDNILFFKKFIKEEKRFVIRGKQNRNITYNDEVHNIGEFAKNLKCRHSSKITYYKDGKEKVKNITYGAAQVNLPKLETPLNLVVVKGFGKTPMLLLTNKKVNNMIQESLWLVLEIYLTRWKCEEVYRYVKQCYNLEDIRVRSYIAIRNIVVLVNAVAYFVTVYIGKNLKLKIVFEKIFIFSKRFFGIPSFYSYAMADGIFNYLYDNKFGITYSVKPKVPNYQLSIPWVEN